MKKVITIEPAAAHQPKKRLRVAAYCRVSTASDEQLVSLETQKAHYEEYIASNPEWEFAGLYYDEGLSGTKKEKRPALLQMMTDCENGKIDFIVTKSLSRFARNTTDCLELVRRLQELHIPVYFEKENLNTGSMETELFLSVMSSLAESESVSISENSKWGVRHRFENGSFKFSYAPYGYTLADGELVIKEDEAEWVRFIFNEALTGKSARQIAATLNEKKVPAKRKGTWTAASVLWILRNERYKGDCLYQKTYTDFRLRRHLNHGEVDQFYEENHHDAIVSREVFEAVGDVISHEHQEKNRSEGNSKYQNRYAFSGKLICGECGAFFKRRINITGRLKYPAWVCSVHHKDGSRCSMKYVRESALETAFTTMMNKLIFGRKEVLQTLLDNLTTQSHKSRLSRIDVVERTLNEMQERRRNLTSIMTKGYLDPATFTRESNEIMVETVKLTAERDQLKSEINGELTKTESLRDLIRFTGKSEMLSDFDAGLFERFVDHAVVSSRTELELHLKCGMKVKETIE